MIKLIALDLDDTLLMPDGTIPEGVAETLREAERRGVGIVIATGRSYPSAKIYAEILGSECPVICYNGAVIRRAGQPPLYSASLSVGLMKRIAFFCRERGLYLQMYDEDHIVVDKICESTLIDPDSKVTGIREIGDLTKAELRPSPKMMILDDPEKIPAIRRDLETLGSALYGEIERISVGNDAEGCFKTEGINSFCAESGDPQGGGHGLRRQYQRYRNAGMGGAGRSRGQRGAGAEKRGRLCGGSAAVFRRGGSGKEICSGVKVPKNKREKQRREDR